MDTEMDTTRQKEGKNMPAWTIHFDIANQICKRIQTTNNNIFTFANIIPDIFEGHNTPNPSVVVKDYSTHYPMRATINGAELNLPDVQKFKEQYKEKFKNPVILGYYTHLLIDRYWNIQLYENHYEIYDKEKNLFKIKLNDGTKQIFHFHEISKIKHNDLRIFSQYLNNNKEIQFPTYDENILKYSKDLKEFKYTPDDIQRTFEYIKENFENKKEKVDEDYKLYTKQELVDYLNNSVKLVKEEILESIRI